MSGKNPRIYFGAQYAIFPTASTAANFPLQLSVSIPFKNIGTIYLIARLLKFYTIYLFAAFAQSLTYSLGLAILFKIF
jgi:hypothetical protein